MADWIYIFTFIRWQGLLLMGILSGILPLAGAEPKESEGASKQTPDTALFDRLGVIKIRITLPKVSLDGLQKEYSNTVVYVRAQIEEGGRTYTNVGLHLRGVSTFQPVNQKPNFTLKFNEFESGQKFHGVRKLRFSNAASDKSYLQEILASEIFRSAGVATPRVNFARLQLNGRDLGLYLMIESVTRDFLEKNFGTDNGNVYEGDETDIDQQLEQDFGKRSRHQSDLNEVVRAAREPNRAKRFEQLEKVLDLDQFISHVAVESLIGVWDGYSMRVNNYRVFCNHSTGKTFFIPHGLDYLFTDTADPLEPKMTGLVSKGLLETPEGHRRYIQKLQEVYVTSLNKESIRSRINALSAAIEPTLKELEAEKAHARIVMVFQERIRNRLGYIGKQLPGLLEAEKKNNPSR